MQIKRLTALYHGLQVPSGTNASNVALRHRSESQSEIINKSKCIIDNMKPFSYRILLRKEPEGGYTVIVPSLPGGIT
jgi:hypothetical protein